MSTVTSAEVWQGINRDDNFLSLPESLRDAVRPYIEAMPQVVSSLLDCPATLDIMMQALAKFLQYCRDNGYIKATLAAIPEEMHGGQLAQEMEQDITDFYGEVLIVAEVLSSPENMQELLASSQATEEEVITSLGLSEEAFAAYQAGNLTIGELLKVDPSFFFQTVTR